jgi:hypothetical protein
MPHLLQVKVWRVPEDGISSDSQATCTSTISVQAPRTNSVKFHPTADNVSFTDVMLVESSRC